MDRHQLNDGFDVWLMMRDQNCQRVLFCMMMDQTFRMQLVCERRGWVSSSARRHRNLDAT